MMFEKITRNADAEEQLLYFTSSSLSKDGKHLFYLSEREGNPNIFCKNLVSGESHQLTNNTQGTLKSYVYFFGNTNRGLSKASISLDPNRKLVYFIQDSAICCVGIDGNTKTLGQIPENQVTAFTHISADGSKLCVPTTDARALETSECKGILESPSHNIDQRVQKENLSSFLRVYDTQTGKEILSEEVKRAWITHVQFSPKDSNKILYNHEWPSDCGVRRMWLWDGQKHIPLRTEGEGRSRHDWTCHEMWQSDGEHIIYHGKYQNGIPYLGRVEEDGKNITEIPLGEHYQAYGHFTVGNAHKDWMVSDGYFCLPEEPQSKLGRWISLQKVNWQSKTIEWIPLCRHDSNWDCQDSHPHPIFDSDDEYVYFTSNKQGIRAVYRIKV